MKWGRKYAKLGKPNQLEGKAAQVRDQIAKFECPRACGWVNMTQKQLEVHIRDECDLREFETKEAVFDQCKVLQKQVEDNEPFYISEIESFQNRI